MRQMHQQSFMVKSLSHTSKGRDPTVPEVLVANMSDNEEDSERRSQGSIEGSEEGQEISHYIQKHINEEASIQQMAQGGISQSREEEEVKQLEETQQILVKHQEFHLPR